MKGTRCEPTSSLVLEVQDCAEREGDPYSDHLRDLIIYGGSQEIYCIQPVPFELLTDQFEEIDPGLVPNDFAVTAGAEAKPD